MADPDTPTDIPAGAGSVAQDLRLSPGQRRTRAIIEILLCSSVPTQLGIIGFMQAAGWPVGPASTLSALVFLALADTLVLIPMMVVLTRAHGDSVSALWFGSRRPLGEAVLGLFLVPPVFVIVGVLMTVLMRLIPTLHNVPENPFEKLATGGLEQAALLGAVAVIAGGVREELQRAFVLRRFDRDLGGSVVGVIVWNTAFGLGHYNQGWDASITTGVLGAFWAVVYLRRRSAVAPILSHAGFNSLEVLRVVITS